MLLLFGGLLVLGGKGGSANLQAATAAGLMVSAVNKIVGCGGQLHLMASCVSTRPLFLGASAVAFKGYLGYVLSNELRSTQVCGTFGVQATRACSQNVLLTVMGCLGVWVASGCGQLQLVFNLPTGV